VKASGDVAIWSLFESLQGPAPTRSSRSPAHHPPNSNSMENSRKRVVVSKTLTYESTPL